MKATVERATLLKCLAHVQSVVERRNTIPILSNVLIEAKDGGLRLMATDLDLQVVETIAAHVSSPGATTVSAHTLFDIARKLPEGAQVELTVAADKMTVTADRYRSNLATLPRDDFPVIAETDLPTLFTLPAETLRTIIDGTRFAISTEETRYYLNGIYLHTVGTGAASDAWPFTATGGWEPFAPFMPMLPAVTTDAGGSSALWRSVEFGTAAALIVNSKFEPIPGSLSSQIAPPSISQSRWQIARPKPVPPCLRLVEASTWLNARKRRCSFSSGIPSPVSRTVK